MASTRRSQTLQTYESIGKVLPGRTNIIVTRQKNYVIPSAIVVDSIQSAFAAGLEENSAKNEAFVIGGEEIFHQALTFSQRIYLTEIQKTFDGDTFFPALNSQEWREAERTIHFSEGIEQLEYHLVILDRKTPSSNNIRLSFIKRQQNDNDIIALFFIRFQMTFTSGNGNPLKLLA